MGHCNVVRFVKVSVSAGGVCFAAGRCMVTGSRIKWTVHSLPLQGSNHSGLFALQIFAVVTHAVPFTQPGLHCINLLTLHDNHKKQQVVPTSVLLPKKGLMKSKYVYPDHLFLVGNSARLESGYKALVYPRKYL